MTNIRRNIYTRENGFMTAPHMQNLEILLNEWAKIDHVSL